MPTAIATRKTKGHIKMLSPRSRIRTMTNKLGSTFKRPQRLKGKILIVLKENRKDRKKWRRVKTFLSESRIFRWKVLERSREK